MDARLSGWLLDPEGSQAGNLTTLVDDVRNRVRLIPPGYPLAAALDGVWGGASWRADGPAGLAQALDQLPGWQSWATPGLTLDALRDSLTPLPAVWTGAGAAALNDDPETGLKYDDANWYLSDGQTIVFEDQAHPGYFYDAAGNWYHRGQPLSSPSDTVQASEPGESAQGLKEAVEEAIQKTLEELMGQGELPDAELAAMAGEALQELLDAFTD